MWWGHVLFLLSQPSNPYLAPFPHDLLGYEHSHCSMWLHVTAIHACTGSRGGLHCILNCATAFLMRSVLVRFSIEVNPTRSTCLWSARALRNQNLSVYLCVSCWLNEICRIRPWLNLTHPHLTRVASRSLASTHPYIFYALAKMDGRTYKDTRESNVLLWVSSLCVCARIHLGLRECMLKWITAQAHH